MKTIIEVNQLERIFGQNRAVDEMTFHVEQGEVFGLLGPNGAGKTTTVRLLNGILPPSGGSMRVFGLDPVKYSQQIRQQTGVLTEAPAVYERLSAHANLKFFATLAGIPEQSLKQRIQDMLALFGLQERAHDKVETYSKGMKQRLALARALIHEPPLLFLDEPTSGLDPEAAQQVQELINDLSHRDGRTILLATHNLVEAQRLCDRVAVVNKGRIVAMGSLKELARKLWPVTWVDIVITQAPDPSLAESLKIQPRVKQVLSHNDKWEIQVESDDAIPEIVRYLAALNARILKINPRDYTLEDIYFALQAGEK